MGKALVGVDIGSTAVRVVEVAGISSEGWAEIRRIGIEPIQPDWLDAGDVRANRKTAVGAALARALKQAGVSGRGIIVGCPTPYASVRRVSVPDSLSVAERTAFIRNQKTQITPVASNDDAALSWNSAAATTDAAGKVTHDLVVAASKRDVIQALVDVCRLAKAEPRAIDLTGAALMRALVRIAPDDDSVMSVLDVGATKTMLATRRGGHLRSVRTVKLGGEMFTQALAQETNGTREDAEVSKRYLRIIEPTSRVAEPTTSYLGDLVAPAEPTPAKSSDAERRLLDEADRLINDISKLIAADAKEHGGRTSAVYLTGGGARVHGFAERLAQQIEVKVIPAPPWAEIADTRRNARWLEGANPEFISDLTVAVGLATWHEPS